MINDIDLDNSNLNSDDRTCFFPSTINFDVLTAKAGPLDNPQNYILGGRLSSEYRY